MAFCIRDMAKAAGAYAKFENPDQFRAVDTENGTRPDLLFVGLTNPEGPYRLQPERVRFHLNDYPSDAPLYGTRVLGTPIGHDAFVESYLHNFIDGYKYSFYRASSHIITT